MQRGRASQRGWDLSRILKKDRSRPKIREWKPQVREGCVKNKKKSQRTRGKEASINIPLW